MSTIQIHFTAPGVARQSVSGKVGKSLMEAAVAARIDGVAADCGGLLTCATCHVFVDPAFWPLLTPPDAEEKAMLAFTATPAQNHSRLSCQIRLTDTLDGLAVELPPTQY
jgi:2Fe-2S ferredoxin